jgi:ABC-type amino acid transport substrate-binding protein
MPGKKLVSTSGSIYDRWLKNCFKNTTFQVVSSPAAGMLTVKNDQADAMMSDDGFLVGVAANDNPCS